MMGLCACVRVCVCTHSDREWRQKQSKMQIKHLLKFALGIVHSSQQQSQPEWCVVDVDVNGRCCAAFVTHNLQPPIKKNQRKRPLNLEFLLRDAQCSRSNKIQHRCVCNSSTRRRRRQHDHLTHSFRVHGSILNSVYCLCRLSVYICMGSCAISGFLPPPNTRHVGLRSHFLVFFLIKTQAGTNSEKRKSFIQASCTYTGVIPSIVQSSTGLPTYKKPFLKTSDPG